MLLEKQISVGLCLDAIAKGRRKCRLGKNASDPDGPNPRFTCYGMLFLRRRNWGGVIKAQQNIIIVINVGLPRFQAANGAIGE